MILDIALGIFLSAFAVKFLNLELTYWLVLACVGFVLLPDMDFLAAWKFKGTAHQHRDLFHYPLILIPLGAIVLLFLGWQWSFLFALGGFLHFLHDSISLGWGVKWLFPFNNKNYAFFRGGVAAEKSFPFRVFYKWTPEEVEKMAREHGDPEWFKHIYLRPSATLIVEILFLIVAIILLKCFL